MDKKYQPLALLISFMSATMCFAAGENPAAAAGEAVITVKTGKWLNKSTATTVKPSYALDVFATETVDPKIPQRFPERSIDNILKSPFYFKSITAREHREEGYTLSVPADKKLYLSSYFEQRPSHLSNSVRYCLRLEPFKAEANKNYVLYTNFVLLGPVSAECTVKIMTQEEYEKSNSLLAESTALGNVSRKELSLRFGSQQAALLTASLISRKSDYLPVYLDAAVDRAQQDINSSGEYAISMQAWLARMVSESNSAAHVAAMDKIVQAALQSNKAMGKKMQKHLDSRAPANTEAYVPKPIVPPSGYSLSQLQILAAQENIKGDNKNEIEAASREILAAPSAFAPADFDQAEVALKRWAQSADEEEVAAAIWAARILAVAKNKKYLDTLNELKKLPVHKKLTKEINLAIEALAGN